MRLRSLLAVPFLALAVCSATANDFSAFCAEKAAAGRVVAGEAPNWFFLGPELKSLGAGEFWQTEPVRPVTAITAYKTALEKLGVALVVVPVPGKAAVCPEKLAAKFPADQPVASFAPLLARLKEAGVLAIDLEAAYRAEGEGKADMYCATDSHWSPLGTTVAAQTVFQAVRELPAVKELIKAETPYVVSEPSDLTITGDLLGDPGSTQGQAETVPAMRVLKDGAPVPPDEASPILLLGDSHTLVFSEKGGSVKEHTTGAGFRDHLQYFFGRPLQTIVNAGSGVDQARGYLARKAKADPSFWPKKKLVIWCFTAREFTNAKWGIIPPLP